MPPQCGASFSPEGGESRNTPCARPVPDMTGRVCAEHCTPRSAARAGPGKVVFQRDIGIQEKRRCPVARQYGDYACRRNARQGFQLAARAVPVCVCPTGDGAADPAPRRGLGLDLRCSSCLSALIEQRGFDAANSSSPAPPGALCKIRSLCPTPGGSCAGRCADQKTAQPQVYGKYTTMTADGGKVS